jgi:spore germination cell wall hydrolase CwlJ-like protein
VTWADNDKFMLALTMWREARHEGHDGMRAVGHVISNRASEWNKSIAEICTQPMQFSSITYPGDLQLTVWPKMHDREFEDAMQITEGLDVDNTGGALYYWNPKTSTVGGWFARNIAGDPKNFERVMQLGAHEFFRPIKKGA